MSKPLYERTSAYACFGKGPFSQATLEAIKRDRKLTRSKANADSMIDWLRNEIKVGNQGLLNQ